MRVLDALEQRELFVHHLLVPLDVLLEDDLDGHLAFRGVGLSDDTIGTGAEGTAELVLRSSRRLDMWRAQPRTRERYLLFIIAFRLAAEAVQHIRNCRDKRALAFC